MSARVSVYYDAEYLQDVLLIEGVRLPRIDYGHTSALKADQRVGIELSSDTMVDDLIGALLKIKQQRKESYLKRNLARLEQESKDAYADFEIAERIATQKRNRANLLHEAVRCAQAELRGQ